MNTQDLLDRNISALNPSEFAFILEVTNELASGTIKDDFRVKALERSCKLRLKHSKVK